MTRSLLVFFLVGCGASSAASVSPVPPRTRYAPPPGVALELGVATIEDGRQGFANAFFFNVDPAGDRCALVDTTVDHGAVCSLRDCRSSDAGPPERLVDLGAVHVSASGRHDVMLRRDERGLYVIDGAVGMRWAPGDALHFALDGGPDGPAFVADVTVPAEPRLLAPPLPPPGTPMPLMREDPLVVRWEAFDGIAYAFLSLTPADDDWWLRHVELDCVVDGADGTLTIPPALLARFAPEDEYFANFAFGARAFVDVRVGERTVRVIASSGRSLDVEYE